MNHEVFDRLFDEQVERCREVLGGKAREYATEDRLHNFRTAAALQGIDPVQALAGMMAKHTVSVYDMAHGGGEYPLELWQEKITDSLNYLFLLNALVREGEEAESSAALLPQSRTEPQQTAQAAERTPNFGGAGGKEKRAIYERLVSYRKARGLGSFRALSVATNGVITEDDVREMFSGMPAPIARWKLLGAALDYVEGEPEKQCEK